jgi:hypothetical protein
MATKKSKAKGHVQIAKRAEWLKQFAEPDQALAAKLLAAIRVVSRDEFASVMTSVICGTLAHLEEAVALYPEREPKKRLGIPNRLFKEVLVPRATGTGKKRRRASGGAPSPFARPRGDRIEIGSEGVVASLIGQIARFDSKRYVSMPGPSLIRRKRIRHFVIVTDFIGSGDRIVNYLTSAWRVRSIRSWYSSKLVRFTVFAFAGTFDGIRRVQRHAASPTVIVAREAPTIDSRFSVPDAIAIEALCEKYNKSTSIPALGYNDTGALISFKHGCPNNVPPIFFDDTGGWLPIFPKRTSIATSTNVSSTMDGFDFDSAFARLGHAEYPLSPSFKKLALQNQKLVLYLVALRSRTFTIEAQNDRTGLNLSELAVLRQLAGHHQLIDKTQRLTDIGIGTLDSLTGEFAKPKGKVTKVPSSYYYPTQLRAP